MSQVETQDAAAASFASVVAASAALNASTLVDERSDSIVDLAPHEVKCLHEAMLLVESEFGLSKFGGSGPTTLVLPAIIQDLQLETAWETIRHLYVFEQQGPDGFMVYQPLGSRAATSILEERAATLRYLWDLGKEW